MVDLHDILDRPAYELDPDPTDAERTFAGRFETDLEDSGNPVPSRAEPRSPSGP